MGRIDRARLAEATLQERASARTIDFPRGVLRPLPEFRMSTTASSTTVASISDACAAGAPGTFRLKGRGTVIDAVKRRPVCPGYRGTSTPPRSTATRPGSAQAIAESGVPRAGLFVTTSRSGPSIWPATPGDPEPARRASPRSCAWTRST
ncbi:hypothetical protein ACRAWF_28950 [Streptomyces sp. L7]